MRTRESEEMYLETILLLRERKSVVRSVDIADELNYAKSSVSRAVGLLKKRGYIIIGSSEEIELTNDGKEKAQRIYKRHRVLTKALVAIGVNSAEAESNACRIEHVISDEAFGAVEKHLSDHEVHLD